MNTGIIRSLRIEGAISATNVFEPYTSDTGCRISGTPSGTNERLIKQANAQAQASLASLCGVKFETGYLRTYLFPTTRLTASGFGASDVEANVGVASSATFVIEVETEIVYFHYPENSLAYPVGPFPIAGGEFQVPRRAHVFGDRVFPGAAYTVSITANGHTASISGTAGGAYAGNVFGVKQPNSAWLPYEARLYAEVFASDQIRIWENAGGACSIVETLPQQTGFCEVTATFLGQTVRGDNVDYAQDYTAVFPFTARANVNFNSGVRVDANGAKAAGLLNFRAGTEYEIRAAIRKYDGPHPETFIASVYRDNPSLAVNESVAIGDGESPRVWREKSWNAQLFGIRSFNLVPESSGFPSILGTPSETGPSGFAMTLPSQTLPGGDPNGDSRMFIRLPKAGSIKVKQISEITIDAGTSTTGWDGAQTTP